MRSSSYTRTSHGCTREVRAVDGHLVLFQACREALAKLSKGCYCVCFATSLLPSYLGFSPSFGGYKRVSCRISTISICLVYLTHVGLLLPVYFSLESDDIAVCIIYPYL